MSDILTTGATMKVNQAFFDEIKNKVLTNKKGEIYTVYSRVLKCTFLGLLTLMFLMVIFQVVLYVIEPSGSEELVESFLLFLGMTLLYLVVFRKQAFTKFTLTPEGLEYKKLFSKRVIPYEELKRNMCQWPVVEYRRSVLITTDKEVIKYDYADLVGGILFLKALYTILEIPMTNEEELMHNVTHKQFGIPNMNQIADYKRRKEYVKKGLYQNK